MSITQETLQLLQQLQANVQQKQGAVNSQYGALRQATAPTSPVMSREGGPAQQRAIMEMGLGMMGHNTRNAPGQTIGASVSRGFEILDEIRGRQRQAGTDQAAVGLKQAMTGLDNAKDSRDYGMKLVGKGTEAPAEWTYGSTNQVMDENGNLYYTTQGRDKAGNSKTVYTPISPGAPEVPKGKIEPLGPKGLTSPQRIQEGAEAKRIGALRANSATNAQAAYEQFSNVRTSIASIDQAIMAMQNGANTGPITDLFPSFTAASKTLDNARAKMGLDIVGATTFGALSKGELDLALNTAIPQGLEEEELMKYLVSKRQAQVKLMEELSTAAAFFEAGGLPSEYMSKLKESGQFERTDPTKNAEIDDIINSILGE